MAFQIEPLRQFLVSPALPPNLSRLGELANNLLWSWDHSIRTLFRRLDTPLWKKCRHNPVLMLNRITQAEIEKAAADSRFVALYRRACERFDSYLEQGQGAEPRHHTDRMLVAYFSMEYGLVESVAIYSGGLGILSGDHMKGASDAQLNLVGVGLLYQKGYFQQHLNPDGWQTEKYPINDFYTLPVQPVLDANGCELRVSVRLPTGEVHVKVWRLNVGRVTLFLLDTNIAENPLPEHRDITDQLYGGDIHVRIRQEIVLGIGGLRALRAAGLHPTVYHMNEGHSAFLAIERVRRIMADRQLSFDEALDAVRTNSVFTTHTSVPAGIDLFDSGLVSEYFLDFCREGSIPFDRFVQLGQRSHPNERFSMAVLALNTSSYRNAVSKLHSEVSQEMFQDLWPQLPVWEVPITSVTNGVHLPTWLNGDLAQLYDQYLQPDWREQYSDRKVWDHIAEIPNRELWEAHRRRKRQLVNFVRERLTQRAGARRAPSSETRRIQELLDPDVFTIGFARRFATYKRAKLIFSDAARLKRILTNPAMPVQLLIAGKAHPRDNEGKALIRDIVQMSHDPELARHIVFMEDYDIEVGREMYQGTDLWLNNPKRGEEACGTSGMKAGINGTLNLSILDGWFDEAYETSGGWAIGDREPYADDQDEIHASAIYSMLENEILPMYYKDRDEGVPNAWMLRVKQSLANLSPQFNCLRMIREYTTQLYEPAHQNHLKVREANYQYLREKSRWSEQVEQSWQHVQLRDGGTGLSAHLMSGSPIELRAMVNLAGLSPEDVRVEAVVGRVGVSGSLEETSVMTLPPVGAQDGLHVFGRQFVPHQTGRLGYTLRISPNHSDDPLTRVCRTKVKWSAE